MAARLARIAPGGGGALLDERAVARAARQRLDAERAGAGEQVEHRGALDGAEAVEAVEDGLARPVARRARGQRPSGATSRRPFALPATTRTRVDRSAAVPRVGGMSAVRIVRIDQGHVRNAINAATAARLHDEFVAFEADDEAKVAVLYGDEQAFCAGANLNDLPTLRPSGPLGPTRLQLSKPVIAAIEGWCVAGGVELAAWCDLRVCGEGARFGCLERRWGVPLVDGGTVRLPRIVGLGRALDLILTGREFDASEAYDIGFANRVVPDGDALEAAVALAEQIAALPVELPSSTTGPRCTRGSG